MRLPSPIHTYFTARAPQDRAAFAAAFAEEAVVRDEGRTHHGPQAISDWWLAAKAKYHHHAEPVETTEVAGRTVVRAKVTGDFPGSLALLTFTFGLNGGRISELEIG